MNKSIVYHYDFNGCFIGATSALIDPLETKLKGETIYLLPANATNIPIPDQPLYQNQAYQFDGISWNVITSYIGQIVYMQSPPYSQERVDYVGELREGWALTQPEIMDPQVY